MPAESSDIGSSVIATLPILTTNSVVGEAYHGTSKEHSESIHTNGFLRNNNGSSYLGVGVYFYDSNKDAAIKWANFRYPESPIGIIRATISLGDCLDFLNEEHVKIIESLYEKYSEHGIELESGQIIDALYKIQKFDTVRVVELTRGRVKQLFEDRNRNIVKTACIIICVKETEAIKNFSIEYRHV